MQTYDIITNRITPAKLIFFTGGLKFFGLYYVNIILTKYIWYKEINIIHLYSKIKKHGNNKTRKNENSKTIYLHINYIVKCNLFYFIS